MTASWTRQSIGALFDIGAGKTMSAAARADGRKVPFLRTSNVLWDEIDLSVVDEMSMSDGELREKSLEPGDLLVCEGGDIGRAAVWQGGSTPMSFQNHLHRLRARSTEIVPRFYSLYLQFAVTQLNLLDGAGNSTTIPNLSRNRLAALEVPLPSREEQQTIVSVLGLVRRCKNVELYRKRAAEQLKQRTMHELFTRGLHGRERRDSEVGPVPSDWDVSPINHHFTLSSGGTPSRATSAYWAGGTIPWVKTGEVDYCVINDTEERITEDGLKHSAAKLLPAGTLLIAMYGQGVTRGKVALLGIPAACNQACAAFKQLDNAVLVKFIYYSLSNSYDALRRISHGGQQQNLNMDLVGAFPVAFPRDVGEQAAIVDTLEAIDSRIELHKRRHAVLERLFESLLYGLMTGAIRISDLDSFALSAAEAYQWDEGD